MMNIFQPIIEIILFFTETFMCFIFCDTFSRTKSNNSYFCLKIVLTTFLCAVLIMLTNYFFEMFSPINVIIILLILIVQQCIISKEKPLKPALLVFVYRGIVSAVTYTVVSLGHYLFGFNSSALSNNNGYFLQKDFPIFISELILCLTILIIKHNTINSSSVPKTSKAFSLIISSLLFLLCLIFPALGLGDFYCFNYEYAYDNIIVITEFALVLIFDVLIVYYLLKPIVSNLYKRQLELAEIKNNMLKNSLNETEQSFELWKKSIHDYKNNIIALTQLAEEGNIDEIKAYLKEENKLLDNRMFYIKTGNSVADAIINTKCNMAKNKGIKYSINAVLEEKNSISSVDLASILGNLLDNAIEACENECDPYIEININKQKSFLIINISNRFTGDFSNKTKKKDTYYHGIGLRSVNRIVKKYDGQFSITRDKDMISTKILIP